MKKLNLIKRLLAIGCKQARTILINGSQVKAIMLPKNANGQRNVFVANNVSYGWLDLNGDMTINLY